MGYTSSKKCIHIHDNIGKAIHPKSFKFKPYSSLREVAKLTTDKLAVLDLSWLANWTQKPSAPLSCNWSGYMLKTYSKVTQFEKSSVLMLPLIDLSPSDPTCILSTLLFVSDKARRLGIPNPMSHF